MDKTRKGGWAYINPELFGKKYIITGGQRGQGRTAAMEARMIQVEGYKAFRGCMRVTVWLPMGKTHAYISGDWLYKPGPDCWYCGGVSYPAEICQPWAVE